METLIKYLIEWFRESKKVNICIIFLWFILAIGLFYFSYILKENSEYASALLNGSMFLFWIVFVLFLLYLSNKWKENIIYKNIKKRIENIRKLLKEKNWNLKISNREVWENYWTLFSYKWASFLYMLDENNDLISININFKDKDKKAEIENKIKWKFITKEELKNYTSVPNNTIILDTLRDLQNQEDEKIVDEIINFLKNI